MAARNKKVKERKWPGLRYVAGRIAALLRTGLVAIGVRGALLGALIVAALWGIHLARCEVARMPRYTVYPAHFRAQAPPWCAEDIQGVRFPQESYSILDPALTHDVAQAYLACPWVKAVRHVRKRFPNGLSVDIELRQPAAFVRLPEACCAIDDEGVRLPLDYTEWDHERRPLPLVFGVKHQPPQPGRRWRDPGAQAAVSVLNALAAEPTILGQMQFVDVGNLDGAVDPLRSEVLLFTRQRVRVEWGRPPNTTSFGEPPVARKLARLRQWLSRPLALAGGGSHIDLRFPDDEALASQ